MGRTPPVTDYGARWVRRGPCEASGSWWGTACGRGRGRGPERSSTRRRFCLTHCQRDPELAWQEVTRMVLLVLLLQEHCQVDPITMPAPRLLSRSAGEIRFSTTSAVRWKGPSNCVCQQPEVKYQRSRPQACSGCEGGAGRSGCRAERAACREHRVRLGVPMLRRRLLRVTLAKAFTLACRNNVMQGPGLPGSREPPPGTTSESGSARFAVILLSL